MSNDSYAVHVLRKIKFNMDTSKIVKQVGGRYDGKWRVAPSPVYLTDDELSVFLGPTDAALLDITTEENLR